MKKTTLIVNHREVAEGELKKLRDVAIDEWHKSEKIIINAEKRRRDSEVIIASCNARLRLLRLMQNK